MINMQNQNFKGPTNSFFLSNKNHKDIFIITKLTLTFILKSFEKYQEHQEM